MAAAHDERLGRDALDEQHGLACKPYPGIPEQYVQYGRDAARSAGASSDESWPAGRRRIYEQSRTVEAERLTLIRCCEMATAKREWLSCTR